METSAAIQALKTSRAMLACLAMLLVLSDVRGQDLPVPSAAGTEPFTPLRKVQRGATSMPANPAEQDFPTLGNPMSPPEQVIVETETWPAPMQYGSD